MLTTRISSFLKDESGATAIEYALIGTLIGIALLSTFAVLGDSLKGLFNNGTAEVLTQKAGQVK